MSLQPDSSFAMTDMPFNVKFDKDNKFEYKQDGKSISLKPIGWKWSGDTKLKIESKKVKPIKEPKDSDVDKIKYPDIFGTGISLTNEITKRGWRKIISIDTLSLGKLPATGYAEFIFEIETDFQIKKANGQYWDGLTDFTFTNPLKLTNNSRIRQVTAWNQDTLINCQANIYQISGKWYLMKKIPVSFLKTASYPVYTDVTITFGSEYAYNSFTTTCTKISSLNSTSAVVAYSYGSYVFCKIATISGTTISYGSAYEAKDGTPTNPKINAVVALSESSFVIIYSNSTAIYAKCGSVSGTTISYGSEVTIDSNTSYSSTSSATALSGSLFVVAYKNNSYYGVCKVGTVSGTTITLGSEYQFSSNSTTTCEVDAITSTSVILTYARNNLYCVVGTVSGTTISYGTESLMYTGFKNIVQCLVLSSTKFVANYADSFSSSSLITRIGEISGTTISGYGTGVETSLRTNNTDCFSISQLDAENYVVAARTSNSTGVSGVKYCSVSGTAITVDASATTLNNGSTSNISSSQLSSSAFITSYVDAGNSSYGTAIVGTIPVSGKKINGVTYSKWNGTAITKFNNQ